MHTLVEYHLIIEQLIRFNSGTIHVATTAPMNDYAVRLTINSTD